MSFSVRLVMINEIGNEAFPVLQLHRVKDATVGVDADQKVVLRRDR